MPVHTWHKKIQQDEIIRIAAILLRFQFCERFNSIKSHVRVDIPRPQLFHENLTIHLNIINNQSPLAHKL